MAERQEMKSKRGDFGRQLIALALSFSVVSCDRAAKEAESAVRMRAKDPDSVKFRNVTRAETTVNETSKGGAISTRFHLVCGEYNAKNSFGAYAGFEPFAFIEDITSTPDTEGLLKKGNFYMSPENPADGVRFLCKNNGFPNERALVRVLAGGMEALWS